MNLAGTTEPFDVVVLDEAHRIREFSGNRFTPASKRTGKSQIEDILDAGRITGNDNPIWPHRDDLIWPHP